MIAVSEDGILYETLGGLTFCEKPFKCGELVLLNPISLLGGELYSVTYNIYKYNLKSHYFEILDYGGGMLGTTNIQSVINKARKLSDVGYLVEIREFLGDGNHSTSFCEYSEGLKFLPWAGTTLMYLNSHKYYVLAVDYLLGNVLLRDDTLSYQKVSFDFILNNQNLFKRVVE